jgi:23S rRNA-/tRNA-specific pseudouridylate synthase
VGIELGTGFLHQIRAMFAHLGHPVAGDALYRGDTRDGTGAARPMLHAAELRVEDAEAVSPDPADFAACLQRLRR